MFRIQIFNVATKITGPKGYYFIAHHSLCITAGVGLCLSCKRCKRNVKEIRKKDFSFPVARHFNSSWHNINDFSVCITSCCYGSNEVRICKENDLVYTLGTLETQGMKYVLNVILHLQAFQISTSFTTATLTTEALCLHSFCPELTVLLETLCITLNCYHFTNIIFYILFQ